MFFFVALGENYHSSVGLLTLGFGNDLFVCRKRGVNDFAVRVVHRLKHHFSARAYALGRHSVCKRDKRLLAFYAVVMAVYVYVDELVVAFLHRALGKNLKRIQHLAPVTDNRGILGD